MTVPAWIPLLLAAAPAAWLGEHGRDPAPYLLGKLERHAIVIVGEGHWSTPDVELVATLGFRSAAEALAEEVAESDPGTVYLVEERNRDEFCEQLYEIGWCAQRLAERHPFWLYGDLEPCPVADRAAACDPPREGD